MFRNESIKAGIQKSFETGTSMIADKICYGYSKASDGGLTINEKKLSMSLSVNWRKLNIEKRTSV